MPMLLVAPFVALHVFIFIAALPVTIPLVSILVAIDEKHLKAAAASTHCARCGLTLGAAAVQKADKTHAAHMATMMNGSRLYRFRRVERRLYAVCTSCGAEFGYDQKHRSFYLLESDDIDMPHGAD
jgi:hypothetical protein